MDRVAPNRIGVTISLVSTTSVRRDEKLRLAFNEGKVRVPMLQQVVSDSRDAWKH